MSISNRGSKVELLKHPAGFLALGAGSGLSPYAPGTVGSFVALWPYLALREGSWWLPWLASVLLFVLGVRASSWVVTRTRVQDPGVIVVDEWVGQWLTLAIMDAAVRWQPQGFLVPSLWSFLLVGFLLFRLFDVLKPWPISWLDRNVKGGLGVMADDAAAGAVAGLVGAFALYIVRWGLVA
jgi:phosphatidylglycerophosphatase A